MDSSIVDFYNSFDPKDEFSFLNTYVSVVIQVGKTLNLFEAL